jgi:hypothetical protein
MDTDTTWGKIFEYALMASGLSEEYLLSSFSAILKRAQKTCPKKKFELSDDEIRYNAELQWWSSLCTFPFPISPTSLRSFQTIILLLIKIVHRSPHQISPRLTYNPSLPTLHIRLFLLLAPLRFPSRVNSTSHTNRSNPTELHIYIPLLYHPLKSPTYRLHRRLYPLHLPLQFGTRNG